MFTWQAASPPNPTWVTQQARQLIWNLDDGSKDISFLIHDYYRQSSSHVSGYG